MSITIIECSSEQDVNRTVDSSWTNTFQEPIPIRTGDSLRVRNTFINTIAGSTGNIIVDEPINCIIWIGYYFIFSDGNDKEWKDGDDGPAPDYMPWIARGALAEDESEQFQPVINQLEFTIPKGVYTPVEMATFISKKFATYVPGENMSNSSTHTDYLQVNTNKFLQTSVKKGVIPGIPLAYPRFYWRGAENVDDNYFYFTEQYLYGANQANLIFNQNDDQLFRFQYLHSPYMDDTGAKIEVLIKTVMDGENVVRALNRQSGVFFTKLEPVSFWKDTLNFDVDNILVKFENGDGKLLTDINKGQGINTTGNSVGIANVSDGKMKLNISDPKGSLVATDQTYAIMATAPLDLLSGGYYLISITPFNVDYHEPTQSRNSIQAIVSRQYIMSNFITGFADSSIPWINTGHDFLLSKVKIEILDAKTKLPAGDINKANAIFLEVIRASLGGPQKKNI